MKLATFLYEGSKWSVDGFPQLDSEHTLVVVFGSSHLLDQPKPIVELTQAYPKAHFIGCSSAGEICGTSISDETLAVAVARFEHSTLGSTAAAVQGPADSYAAGELLARQLQRPSLKGLFILSDGLKVNGTELVKGINAVIKGGAVVTGGLAGDGDRFQRTWVLNDRKPCAGFVSAVAFYGDQVQIGHGSKGGWDIFGPERSITRSAGNVLMELDRAPALELYKNYLGDRAAGLPATGLLFPLAIRANTAEEKRLVRTILAVDEEQKSMTFAGDMPEGWLAQLMKTNFDRLITGASDAGLATKERGGKEGPFLSIAISCVGRRLVLGERTEEEVEATLEALPDQAAQIGYYSYGEISPYATGPCDLHNQTMTLTLLSEC